MSTLTCWLNTSPTKSTVWLTDKSGLLKGSIFVNFESTQARDIMVNLLREAYSRGVSFEMMVEVSSIQTRQNGSLSLASSLGNVLAAMVETVKAPPKPVDSAAIAKAEALLAGLQARPVVSRAAASVAAIEVDDDFEF